jgi:hypothetical protein
MSRSKHITSRDAKRRFAQGDLTAVVEFAEKRNLKSTIKKFRHIYQDIHDSALKTPKLRNSTALSAVKLVTEGQNTRFLEEQKNG